MTIAIDLDSRMHTRLEQQARASGKDVATYIAETLETALAETGQIDAVPECSERSEMLARFDAWASRRRSWNPNFDDSRESIYPDGN